MSDYTKPSPITARGKAPGLAFHLLGTSSERKTYVLAFGKGDEVASGLTEFAEKHQLDAAHFSGIGAFERARLAWFDREKKAYRVIPVDEPTEVLSILGNVAIHEGEFLLHSHCTLGRADGSTVGGHLLEAFVYPTLELYLTQEAGPVSKRPDPETGLELMYLSPKETGAPVPGEQSPAQEDI